VIICEGGTAWILPLNTEEVHGLDRDHVAAISHDGEIEVHESVGTIAVARVDPKGEERAAA
jgi:hypothetical protein